MNHQGKYLYIVSRKESYEIESSYVGAYGREYFVLTNGQTKHFGGSQGLLDKRFKISDTPIVPKERVKQKIKNPMVGRLLNTEALCEGLNWLEGYGWLPVVHENNRNVWVHMPGTDSENGDLQMFEKSEILPEYLKD